MLNHVVEETVKETQKDNLTLDRADIEKIVTIAIDKFTVKWTIDMADANHNIHTDLL